MTGVLIRDKEESIQGHRGGRDWSYAAANQEPREPPGARRGRKDPPLEWGGGSPSIPDSQPPELGENRSLLL